MDGAKVNLLIKGTAQPLVKDSKNTSQQNSTKVLKKKEHVKSDKSRMLEVKLPHLEEKQSMGSINQHSSFANPQNNNFSFCLTTKSINKNHPNSFHNESKLTFRPDMQNN